MHVEQLLELAERQLYAISPLLTFSNKNSALSASPYGPATIELLVLTQAIASLPKPPYANA
jgi:hypothetical protein